MTDMEFIRMRQAEGRDERANAQPAAPARSTSRIAALMRLARQGGAQPRGQRPQRQA